MTAHITGAADLGPVQRDLVDTAMTLHLELHCLQIAHVSNVHIEVTDRRITQLDAELDTLWDEVANLQTALRAT
jgi:hypothetical protein